MKNLHYKGSDESSNLLIPPLTYYQTCPHEIRQSSYCGYKQTHALELGPYIIINILDRECGLSSYIQPFPFGVRGSLEEALFEKISDYGPTDRKSGHTISLIL